MTKKFFMWAINDLIKFGKSLNLNVETEKIIFKFLEYFFSDVNARFDFEKFREYYWARKFGVRDALRKEDLKRRVAELKEKGFEVKIKKSKFNEGLYFLEAKPPIDESFFD
jgi:hypothetical protein